jgi:hypothetical protein
MFKVPYSGLNHSPVNDGVGHNTSIAEFLDGLKKGLISKNFTVKSTPVAFGTCDK